MWKRKLFEQRNFFDELILIEKNFDRKFFLLQILLEQILLEQILLEQILLEQILLEQMLWKPNLFEKMLQIVFIFRANALTAKY